MIFCNKSTYWFIIIILIFNILVFVTFSYLFWFSLFFIISISILLFITFFEIQNLFSCFLMFNVFDLLEWLNELLGDFNTWSLIISEFCLEIWEWSIFFYLNIFVIWKKIVLIFFYLYPILILFMLILLTLMLFFYLYLGKIYLYKTYNFYFFVLFFSSVIVQAYLSRYQHSIFMLDISQNFIFFNVNVISFTFDKITNYFSTTTVQIAFFVNFFSFFYMKNEQKFEKFFFFLNYFVFSMILLLHSNNFIMLFLFWELIGITSFFLINFYELKSVSFKSSFKAFSFNRISDVCILISIIVYWNVTGSFSISNANIMNFFFLQDTYSFFFMKISTINVFLFFLTIAAFCKSAQFGFHFWLPDSMEAPAPASALIHSATLVSAGLFLIIKFYILYKISYFFTTLILFISSITILFGAIVSSVQTDLKRLLAYSTISNCGLLFVSCFLSNISHTLFLFQLHGLTKSLAFLFVGFLIINFNHNQDIRVIGKLNFLCQFFIIGFMITTMYLAAWVFSPNSFIKHIIMFNNYNYNYLMFVKIILLFSSVFSVLYSLKSFIYFLFSCKKFKKQNYNYTNINALASILCTFFFFVFYFIFKKFFFFKSIFVVSTTITFFYKFMLITFFITIFSVYFIYGSNKIKKYNKLWILVFFGITFFINFKAILVWVGDKILEFIVIPIYKLYIKPLFSHFIQLYFIYESEICNWIIYSVTLITLLVIFVVILTIFTIHWLIWALIYMFIFSVKIIFCLIPSNPFVYVDLIEWALFMDCYCRDLSPIYIGSIDLFLHIYDALTTTAGIITVALENYKELIKFLSQDIDWDIDWDFVIDDAINKLMYYGFQ